MTLPSAVISEFEKRTPPPGNIFLNFPAADNQFQPANFSAIIAAEKKEFLTSTDRERIAVLVAKSKEFADRKATVNRQNLQKKARDEAAAFATGEGPMPGVQSKGLDETQHELNRAVRRASDQWFEKEARDYLVELHDRMIARVQSFAQKRELVHKDEAQALGVPYVMPPVLASIQRRLYLLGVYRKRFETNAGAALNLRGMLAANLDF